MILDPPNLGGTLGFFQEHRAEAALAAHLSAAEWMAAAAVASATLLLEEGRKLLLRVFKRGAAAARGGSCQSHDGDC